MNKKSWIYIFISILVLTSFASIYSLISNDIYVLDSEMIRVKCHYLDIVNISLIVPFGTIMLILSLKNMYWAKLAAIGVSVYLLYMFGFNSLSLRFNELFLIYIIIFGLCIFCSVLGFLDLYRSGKSTESKIRMRISSVYLFLFAVIPGAAWITEIIRSIINSTVPDYNLDMNISVNIVHVFDLAFVFPLIILSGIQLIKGKKSGRSASFISVIFILLTCFAILVMEIGLIKSRLNYDQAQLYSMFILIPLGIFPLITLYKEVNR